MEPNNFEKDFREKLNQREIEPSNKAWDRLDAMLAVAEEKEPVELNSKKSKSKWLYIAASFIGFLLVGTLFFNQNKNAVKTPETVVVEKEKEKESITEPVLNTVDSVKTETAIAEKTSEETGNKNEKNNPKVSGQISNKITQNKSNQIAESSIIKNNQEKQSTNNPTLIAETSKQDNVDQLLEKAETKILAENAVKSKSKIKINSNDLLDQVDGELELSFREKMIAKINKSYQTVKVAVENRNVKN